MFPESKCSTKNFEDMFIHLCVCVCTALIDGRTDRQTLCDSKDHAYASHRAVKTLLGMNSLVTAVLYKNQTELPTKFLMTKPTVNTKGGTVTSNNTITNSHRFTYIRSLFSDAGSVQIVFLNIIL